MRATFKLSDYGGTAPVHIFVGASGKQHTFSNKRDGHGYRLEFEGTPEAYDRLMRDLLCARHPYHSVFVYFLEDENYIAALRQSVTDLQSDNEKLTTANQALASDVSELRMQLDEKTKSEAARSKGTKSAKVSPPKKRQPVV